MIYFIQDSGTLDIKIGYTATSAEARMATLQTGNPSRLVLLATIAGGRPAESALHAWFAAHRVSGEWFRPASMILAYLLRSDGIGDMLRDAAEWLEARSRSDSFSHSDADIREMALDDGIDGCVFDFARRMIQADITIGTYPGGAGLWWGNKARPAEEEAVNPNDF